MAEHQNGNVRPPNGKVTESGSPYSINLESFGKRLKAFYTHWNEHKAELWGSSDVVAIATPLLQRIYGT